MVYFLVLVVGMALGTVFMAALDRLPITNRPMTTAETPSEAALSKAYEAGYAEALSSNDTKISPAYGY